MDNIDNGGPAFPTVHHERNAVGDLHTWDESGMTLRDYFAAQALIGLLTEYYPEQAVDLAYKTADAMIKARKEGV